VSGAPKTRRRPRIDPGFGRVGARQVKRPHTKPLRSKISLNWTGWEIVLVHAIYDLQTLPVINIDDGMTVGVADAFETRGQSRIDVDITALVGRIVRVRTYRRAICLAGSIVDKPGRNGIID